MTDVPCVVAENPNNAGNVPVKVTPETFIVPSFSSTVPPASVISFITSESLAVFSYSFAVAPLILIVCFAVAPNTNRVVSTVAAS